MEFVKIDEDGKISEYICSDNENLKKDSSYKEVTGLKFNGSIGLHEEEIDWKTGKVKSDAERVRLGYLVDNRGLKIYDKSTRLSYTITMVGIEIPDGFTKLKPGPFDVWERGKWVEDKEEKKAFETAEKVEKAKTFLSETSLEAEEAMESGEPLKKVNPELYEKRRAARGVVRTLSI